MGGFQSSSRSVEEGSSKEELVTAAVATLLPQYCVTVTAVSCELAVGQVGFGNGVCDASSRTSCGSGGAQGSLHARWTRMWQIPADGPIL